MLRLGPRIFPLACRMHAPERGAVELAGDRWLPAIVIMGGGSVPCKVVGVRWRWALGLPACMRALLPPPHSAVLGCPASG